MQIFSTREIATVIWVTLTLIYVMRRRDFRASLFKFIKAIFAKKLLLIVHFSELSERKREKQKTTCYAGGGEKASASSIPKQPPYIV